MERKIPTLLVIDPALMIHEHKLKGLDLLVYAWFMSVYKLTAKAVFVNKTYLADIFNYDVRNVRRCIERLVKCGLLIQYNNVFIPADGMCKGDTRTKSPTTRTKSPTTRIKSPTINETIIIQEEEEIYNKEIWDKLLKEIADKR